MARKATLFVTVVVVGGLALVALLIWGAWMASDGPAFLVAYMGLLANVVMAAAAVRMWALSDTYIPM